MHLTMLSYGYSEWEKKKKRHAIYSVDTQLDHYMIMGYIRLHE